MYAQNVNTFNAYYSSPLYSKINFENVPYEHICRSMKECKGQKSIDATAVEYYLSSHALHLLQNKYPKEEQMPENVYLAISKQKESLNEIAMRVFYYLIKICPEEAQFGQERNAGIYDFISNSVSPRAAEYAKSILSRGGSAPKDLTIYEALKSVEMIFRFAQWTPGFGGLAWAQITQVALEVVSGNNSLDLMVDKAFTLSHNNGAIFNKGHFFSMYTRDFYSILDIQASGQIPQAINEKKISGHDNEDVKNCFKLFLPFCQKEFKAPFDVKRVKSMEKVRQAKEAALQKQISAYYNKHSGHGHSGSAQNKIEQTGPAVRLCDTIISVDDYEDLRSESTFKQGFKIPKR